LYAKFEVPLQVINGTWFINNIPKKGFQFEFELKPRHVDDYTADALQNTVATVKLGMSHMEWVLLAGKAWGLVFLFSLTSFCYRRGRCFYNAVL
jgi:hypothetical protein